MIRGDAENNRPRSGHDDVKPVRRSIQGAEPRTHGSGVPLYAHRALVEQALQGGFAEQQAAVANIDPGDFTWRLARLAYCG